MSEDINVGIAEQATSPGLVVYHLQRFAVFADGTTAGCATGQKL
jgi:hypothetical protein